MAKEKEAPAGQLWRELLQLGVYKRSQGRITRQVTFGAVAGAFLIGAWRLSDYLLEWGPSLRWGISGVVALVGLWFAFRLVNLPRFADFLIAVEAEMNKVSWPTRTELIRGSTVVIVVIFILAAILFAYDTFWRLLLSFLGVL